MTPQFTQFYWDYCPESEFLPQNISFFFSDFDSELRQKRGEKIYLLEYIWPKSCRLMEHTHILGPHKKNQRHSIHMSRENECQPKFTRTGVTSAVCIGPNFQTEQNMSEMEYICLGKN
jgi:hypothetical protein